MHQYIHAHVFDYIEKRLTATRVYSQFVHRDRIKDGWITPFVKSHESFIRQLIQVSSLSFILPHILSPFLLIPPSLLFLLFLLPSSLHSYSQSMSMNLVMHSLTLLLSPPFLLSSMLSHN